MKQPNITRTVEWYQFGPTEIDEDPVAHPKEEAQQGVIFPFGG